MDNFLEYRCNVTKKADRDKLTTRLDKPEESGAV
jgi:hypothetical protein